MTARRPTIILVHGAFHQPEHFNSVETRLRTAGYKVVLPRLPSVGLSLDPGDALHLDAGVVRDALEEVVHRQERDAVLVMHSYGGIAGIEGYGMFREESSEMPAATTQGAQVRRLVYLAAHGPVEKGSVFKPPDVKLPHLSVNDSGIVTHLPSYERFYEGDCSREKAQPAIDMCLPMAVSAFTTPTKYSAWKDHGTPCTYIKCLNDRAVLPGKCDMYIANMREADVDVDVETMDCGHSPAHVAPKELADLLIRIAG